MNTLFNLTNWRRIKKGPGTVNALLAMADPAARRALRQAIQRDIPASFAEVDSKKDLHHAVTFTEFDIIIADSELGADVTFDLVEQIRFGRLHCHAFPIIVLMTEPNRDRVHQLVADCGADVVMSARGAPDAISDHIARLTDQRRPFVVAPHYIGPERRAAARENEPTAEQVLVPNPLSARAGAVSEDEYRRAISVATHNISLMRRCLYSLRSVSSVPPRSAGETGKGLLV